MHARRAYEALAPLYDRYTAGHDHAAWCRDLEALAVRAGLRGRRLLDVACGTGNSFLPFLARGYEVTACDLSPAMAALAAEKSGGRARVEVHDMRRLPQLGAFDLVLSLADAVNYLTEDGELEAALTGMRRNLAPGGVVVFDVNCVRTYRETFTALNVVPSDDAVIVWRGEASRDFGPGERAGAVVQVLERTAGGWRDTSRRHLQRHHPEEDVRRALSAAGLRLVDVRGMDLDGSMRPGFDELACSKAVYVATGMAT
jgi:SAM-dependent methyltransferase